MKLFKKVTYKPFLHMSVFSPHMCIRRFDREGHTYSYLMPDMRTSVCRSCSSRISGWFRGEGGGSCKGVGYDVGWRFTRGGIICFGLTADGTEAERAELIAIILNVAAAVDERLEHELEMFQLIS